MALKKCKECGRELSSKADACPGCGAPQKSKQYGCGSLLMVIILIIFIYAIFSSINESSPPPPPLKTPALIILNEKYANSADLSLAKKALDDLPTACGNSSIAVSKDGTVSLHYLCSNFDKSEDITVSFKNGKVTKLR